MRRASVRLVLSALLSLLAFHCQPAYATCTAPTGYTNFTLANLNDASGQNPLASGQISIIGTDINNNPLNYHVGATGGGVVMKRPVLGTVVSGAVSGCLYIADSALTIPPSVYYHVQVRDTSSTSAHALVVDEPGVYITGANFVFDTYNFPAPPALPAFGGGVVQGNLYVNGTVGSTGAITAPEYCLGTSCVTGWPSGYSGGSMTWPSGTGLACISGGASWCTTYNASNVIPATFLPALSALTWPSAIPSGTSIPWGQVTSQPTIPPAAASDGTLGGGSPSATVPPTQSAVQAYVAAHGSTGGSMTWPSGTGLACISGGATWCTTYNASNVIPATFLPALSALTWPSAIPSGTSIPWGQVTSQPTIPPAAASDGTLGGGSPSATVPPTQSAVQAYVAANAGSSIKVNSTTVSNPNFNTTTPSADSGNTAITFKCTGSNCIGEIPIPSALANANITSYTGSGTSYTSMLGCYNQSFTAASTFQAASPTETVSIFSVPAYWRGVFAEIYESTTVTTSSGTITSLTATLQGTGGANATLPFYLMGATAAGYATYDLSGFSGASTESGTQSLSLVLSVANAAPGNLGTGSASNLTAGVITVKVCGVTIE